MFRPTYYLPNLEMIGGRPAREWDDDKEKRRSKTLDEGDDDKEKRRAKTLDDLPDFKAMIVHVEGIGNKKLKRLSPEREMLWKNYFGTLNRSHQGKEDRVWLNRNAELLKSIWKKEMKKEAASIIGFGDIDFVRDAVKKGCLCDVCRTSNREEHCKSLLMTAKSVAQLTMYGLSHADLSVFKDRLISEKYNKVRDRLFSAVAGAVLSIFDMEDFKRIHNSKEVPHGLSPDRVDVNEFQINTAVEVIGRYIPLKEYYKRELSLELAHKTCFHVFDTLVIKVLRSTPLWLLLGSVAHKKVYQHGDAVKDVEFRNFIEGLIKGLLQLGAMKSVLLKGGIDGQASCDESRVAAETPKDDVVWRNPIWKEDEILPVFELGWTTSGEVKLKCDGKDFVKLLLSKYSEMATPIFHKRFF